MVGREPATVLQEGLKKKLQTAWLGNNIYGKDCIPSTNELAKKLAEEGAAEGTLVITDLQTSGKGTQGKIWESPAGKGLLFSFILRPPIPSYRLPQITLLTAVVLADIIEEKIFLKTKIKWPNDIYIRDKKVAGILTEASSLGNEIKYVIVGIGINVNTTMDELNGKILQPFTSLFEEKNELIDRYSLLASFLGEYEKEYEVFCEEGFFDIRERWLQKACGIQEKVLLEDNKKTKPVTILGIDQYGALLVRTEEGLEERYLSGQVHISKSLPQR